VNRFLTLSTLLLAIATQLQAAVAAPRVAIQATPQGDSMQVLLTWPVVAGADGYLVKGGATPYGEFEPLAQLANPPFFQVVAFDTSQVAEYGFVEFAGDSLYDNSEYRRHGRRSASAAVAEATLLFSDEDAPHAVFPAAVVDGLGDFTFSAALRIEDHDKSQYTWVSCARVGQQNAMILAYEWNHDNWALWIENVRYQFDDDATIEDGLEHLVAVVRSGSSAALFVDGQPSGGAISVPPTPLAVGAGGFVLGQEQDVLGGGFALEDAWVGGMRDMRVWKRALSPEEIEALHAPEDE